MQNLDPPSPIIVQVSSTTSLLTTLSLGPDSSFMSFLEGSLHDDTASQAAVGIEDSSYLDVKRGHVQLWNLDQYVTWIDNLSMLDSGDLSLRKRVKPDFRLSSYRISPIYDTPFLPPQSSLKRVRVNDVPSSICHIPCFEIIGAVLSQSIVPGTLIFAEEGYPRGMIVSHFYVAGPFHYLLAIRGQKLVLVRARRHQLSTKWPEWDQLIEQYGPSIFFPAFSGGPIRYALGGGNPSQMPFLLSDKHLVQPSRAHAVVSRLKNSVRQWVFSIRKR
ncbi:hypothetical protein D9757_007786 [Collybiopsis confluens]|uniref:Uncharacterized protein n=1 Tax=Collybiopsis confluens TaxID=2823264 RepID=A0A8H5HQR1_9AGAR|nr:hypothetical protein D9757_007786 [Collybiopsis confluens]